MFSPEKKHNTEQTEATTQWDTLKSVPFNGAIERKYDALQRPLIDEAKESFRNHERDSFTVMDHRHETTKLQKIGHLVAANPVLHRILPRVYERSLLARKREADQVAKIEYQAELTEEFKKRELEYEQQKEQERQQQEKLKLEQEQREQKRLDREFLDAATVHEYNRSPAKLRQQERMQEISELAFSKRFTQLEDLDAESYLGEEVEKSTRDYEGKAVTVYTLHGRELCCLLHAIDFKGRGGDSDKWRIGSGTAKKLQDDPSFWTSKPDNKTQQQANMGTSTTLSTTFFDSSRNFNLINKNDIWDYGFNHLPAGSLIQITLGDGGTPQLDQVPDVSKLDDFLYTPEQITPRIDPVFHNEFWLKRYDDNGNPILPNFILTSSSNGQEISDTMLKHAAFFDVPIISIDRIAYSQKERARINNLAKNLPSDANYEELISAFDDIADSFVTSWNVTSDHLIGRPERQRFGRLEGLPENLASYAENLELEKRMEYIRHRLEEETANVHAATAAGGKYYRHEHGIGAIGHRKHGKILPDGSQYNLDYENRLDLEIEIGGKTRSYQIHDAKHPVTRLYEAQKADPDDKDFYSEFAPLMDEYIAALEENGGGPLKY